MPRTRRADLSRLHPGGTAGQPWPSWRWSLLTMTAALRFVVRAVASTDQRREALEELTLGLSFVRGELQRAEPLMHKVGQNDLVLFAGGQDRLRFVNVEPPYLAGSPYNAFEFAVVADAGAWRLELRRAPSTLTSRTSRPSRLPSRGLSFSSPDRCSSPTGVRSGRGILPPGTRSGARRVISRSPCGWRQARTRAGPISWCPCASRHLGTAPSAAARPRRAGRAARRVSWR